MFFDPNILNAAIETGNVAKYGENKQLPADFFFSSLLREIQDGYKFSSI